MFENISTSDVILSAFCLWKKFLCALILKHSEKQLFCIVNSSKVGRCHPHFINRASKYYLYSINKNATRFILVLLLKKLYLGDRGSKCHSHSIIKSAGRCSPCITIESH